MKSLCKKGIRSLPFLLVVLICVATPAAAAVSQIILTESVFLTAEKGFYTESLQTVLTQENSALASYSETLSGHTSSAAEIIWLGSQNKDYGFNPKVLLVNLKVLGWLDQKPSSLLTPFVQSMTENLWEGYSAYLAGTRTVTLKTGNTVQISNSNSATFALAYFLASGVDSETGLTDLLLQWKTAYKEIFAVDPAVEKQDSIPHAISGVKPFMQLPFAQSESSFIAVNSFFDHSVPSVFDDSILRFDGKTVTTASFSTCELGVSCYGGHNGIDYKTGAGMPILAAADGKVVYKYYNTDSSVGRVDSGLYIDHNNGFRTAYWHMDPIAVEYGQTVKAGDVIGYSGNIGNSSGAHLHFGLRLVAENKPVDPFGWWSNALTDEWGSSEWMWNGDLTADMGEAQTQLFYRTYWYRVNSGYDGSSFWTYEMSTQASSTNWAIWGTYIDTPGKYNVYAYWPKDSTNTKHARYTVFHSTGTNTVVVDQSANGDQFIKLGTYTLAAGPAAVTMNDYTGYSGGKIRFDAVKWELASAVTSTPEVTAAATGTADPAVTSTPVPQATATALPTNTATTTTLDTQVNLALDKEAAQSSQFGTDPVLGQPKLAVDGNTSGVYSNSSVTHTANNAQAWWQVDLGAVQNIAQIAVWNRTDCCTTRLSNFYVLVSDVPFTSTKLDATINQSGVSSYYFAGAAARTTWFDINRTGRYVRVQFSGSNYLSLAEVQIWSPGSDGTTMTGTTTPTSIPTNIPSPTPTSISTNAPSTTPTSISTNAPSPIPTLTSTSTPSPTLTATSITPTSTVRVNLALKKSAIQSSQYGTDRIRGKPILAVDGNTNGVYSNSSVTHTNNNAQAWWQVDLGAVQNIAQIAVWNRTDCCTTRLSNFYVLVSDVPFTSTGLKATLAQSGVSSYYFTGTAARTTWFDINRTGRYVRVQLSGTNYLSLAEVQIWSNEPENLPTPLAATPDPSSLYNKQADYPYYLPNFAHPDNGNNWFGVAGQVFNEKGVPVNQIKVVIKGKLNGVSFEKSTQTGLSNDYGPGGYEIVLGSAPAATSSNLNIRLYSLTGQPLSDTIYFTTYADSLKNLVLINFEKR